MTPAGQHPETAQRLVALIAPVLTEQGLELVRLTYGGGQSQRPTLQIMAELPDGTMTVEACSRASRAVSELLDAEDPIADDYVLEVSSPGIDRPLTRPKDFIRWSGFEVRVALAEPIDGRKRFHGRVGPLEGATLTIDTEHGPVPLPIAAIGSAKLVLTDALIAATQPQSANDNS
jgi:ribosome maturation factor RimP